MGTMVALDDPMSHTGCMAKKKGSPRSGDRHKPSMMVRVNVAFARAIEALTARNATTVTQEVNRAVRELLTREGLWPPKDTG